jgi:hypothetical protein
MTRARRRYCGRVFVPRAQSSTVVGACGRGADRNRVNHGRLSLDLAGGSPVLITL